MYLFHWDPISSINAWVSTINTAMGTSGQSCLLPSALVHSFQSSVFCTSLSHIDFDLNRAFTVVMEKYSESRTSRAWWHGPVSLWGTRCTMTTMALLIFTALRDWCTTTRRPTTRLIRCFCQLSFPRLRMLRAWCCVPLSVSDSHWNGMYALPSKGKESRFWSTS